MKVETKIDDPPRMKVSVQGDRADDHIAVSVSGGFLKVNGADPVSGGIDFSTVGSLGVGGGPGDDSIDLRGVVGLAPFAAQLQGGGIAIAGQGGNDRLWGPTFSLDESGANEGRGLLIYVHMVGGRGADRIFGSRDGDALFGGAGPDRLYGRDGIDTISGGAGNDVIFGGANGTFSKNPHKQEQIYGGAGGPTP